MGCEGRRVGWGVRGGEWDGVGGVGGEGKGGWGGV